MREELQALLDENPHLESTAMLDSGQVATLTIVDGVPGITLNPMPESFNYDLPDVEDMHGTPICRIYHLLKNLNLFEEENKAMAAATAQMQAARVPAEEGVRIEAPTMPTAPEIVVSTVSGNTSLPGKRMVQVIQALAGPFTGTTKLLTLESDKLPDLEKTLQDR